MIMVMVMAMMIKEDDASHLTNREASLNWQLKCDWGGGQGKAEVEGNLKKTKLKALKQI